MPTLQHNGIRNIFGQLLTEMCPSVGIEPMLQPLSGETYRHRSTNTEDGARLDIRAQRPKEHLLRCQGLQLPCPFKLHVLHWRLLQKALGASWRWSMGHSHHWCGLQVEAVDHLPQLPSRGLISEKHGQPYSSALSFIKCGLPAGTMHCFPAIPIVVVRHHG